MQQNHSAFGCDILTLNIDNTLTLWTGDKALCDVSVATVSSALLAAGSEAQECKDSSAAATSPQQPSSSSVYSPRDMTDSPARLATPSSRESTDNANERKSASPQLWSPAARESSESSFLLGSPTHVLQVGVFSLYE
jgi:hypothetical protein